MEKPKFFTPKFQENAACFLFYALAVTLSPLLAWPLARLFEWVVGNLGYSYWIGYGFLLELYAHIFTAAFWGIEGLLFFKIRGRRKAKKGAEGLEKSPASTQETPKVKAEPLPLRNVWILSGIVCVCVLVVSAVIGFEVKPFHDISERGAGFAPWCEVGVIGLNALKCIWITAMLIACKNMADEIVAACFPTAKPFVAWLLAWGIFMLFGLVDIFSSVLVYPLTGRGVLMGLTYVLFYAAFVAVHYFTQERRVKSYLLIAFIYLF